jgi:hypothetical protein
MPKPSMARNFFDQIRSAPDPIAFIRGLVNSNPPTYETDWLDFKQQPSTNLKDQKWREMLVETLAGFANNQGGVILWGIEARKDPTTNVDAACGEKPVDNPVGLKSRLIELQRSATDKPLANVEVEAYELPSSPGTGFVACFVPEGPYKPYQTQEGRRSQYYLRAGDSFFVMPPPVLAAMFYPRTQAMFKASAKLSWTIVDGPRPETRQHEERLHVFAAPWQRWQGHPAMGWKVAKLTCEIDLVNEGTATAKDVLVVMKQRIEGNLERISFVGGALFHFDSVLSHDKVKDFQAVRPIHPHQVTPLFTAVWTVELGVSGSQPVPNCPAPSLDLDIYCENQGQQAIRIEFDTAEMIAKGEGCYCEARPAE